MVFSSLNFLYLFFPLVMLLHFIVPEKRKNPVLLAASLYFYAWGEPVYIALMLFSVAYNYLAGMQLGLRRGPGGRRAVLAAALLVNLAVLGFFKYAGFLADSLNSAFGLRLPNHELPLPIGISFYTFQALSYIIDVYRGKTRPQRSLLDFAVYITMFPQLVAGPIVKYSDIEAQLARRKTSLVQCGQGMERMMVGLAKKVLLANNLGMVYEAVQAAGSRSVMTAWLGAVAYALQIYFDFSGYSDMAIGMGRMLGFTFPENFDHPYLARNVTEFWRRWHISLSGWFRDYVYIPLGGNRAGTLKHVRNLLIVWMLTGLWHGASWNFVLWGLYFFVFLVLEKFVYGEWLKKTKVIKHIYLLVIVYFGWILFKFTEPSMISTVLRGMIGANHNHLSTFESWKFLGKYFLFFFICILACTPLVKNLSAMLRKASARGGAMATLNSVANVALPVCLLIVSVLFLIGDSYNPFLYFRF
jgi:alginate O-acetyltransferase complex protein AlgI